MTEKVHLQADDSAATAILYPGRGGLLAGLTLEDRHRQPVELLWLPPQFNVSDSGWPGGGIPICFPFAGRVFHQGQAMHYQLAGRDYHMPLHGFVYAMPWDVHAASARHAELCLRASPQSAELFPYNFRIAARYDLHPTALDLSLIVEHLGPDHHIINPAQRPPGTPTAMPVSLGLHPYFRMPLGSQSTIAGCRLVSSATTKLRVTPVGGAGKASPYPETPDERQGLLTNPMLANLILGGMDDSACTLVDGAAGLGIRMSWTGPVRYLVLWSQVGKGFHCVEPWMGLPDALHNGDGCQWLEPGQSLSLGVRLELTS